MVNTAQGFKTRYPLVDGHGNWGNMDGDSAAAMRYTEARLTRVGSALIGNIDKDCVDFVPNFDNSLKQPKVLPTLIPNVLINGTSGIAVGMSTNMFPHNISEVYDALIYIINALCDGIEPETETIMEYIKGPDFPMGAQIVGVKGIRDAYLTGKGKIKMRSVYHEEKRGNTTLLVFTELPYKMNKATLIDKIDDIAKVKIEEVKDVYDESDKDGTRLVVELKKDVDPTLVVNKLFKYTELETTETINNLVLVEGVPRVLTLVEILEKFLEHAIDVVRRETSFDLDKSLKRLECVQAMLWALREDVTDRLLAIIRASQTQVEAQEGIIALYNETVENGDLTIEQTKFISDLRFRQLIKENRGKLEAEEETLIEGINRFNEILGDDMVLMQEVGERFVQLKEKYGDERRTEIIQADDDIDIEALIKDETLVLTYTSEGIIKTVEESVYNTTNRGARGVKGSSVNEDECITLLQTINSKDHLFFFTNKGRCLTLRAYMIPKSSRTARGKYIGNYLQLQEDESIVGFIPADKNRDEFFFLTTKKGTVKRIAFDDLPKRNAGIVININEGDELISINVVNEKSEVIITTDNAMSIRFKVEDVRPMGRAASGVRGIKLREEDHVVDAIVVDTNEKLLTVTENGIAKRSEYEDYRVANRGGVGITTHKLNDRTGKLVCALSVQDDDEILIATQQGLIVRTKVSNISITGRSTSGVKAVTLYEDDCIVSVSKIKPQEEEEVDA